MKLWLDDIRRAPEGWTHVKTMKEAQDVMLNEEVEYMSLDHDLGDCGPCEPCINNDDCMMDPSECRCGCHRELQPTGYDFCVWMASNNIWPKHKPTFHTANPVGRANMNAAVERYFDQQQ